MQEMQIMMIMMVVVILTILMVVKVVEMIQKPSHILQKKLFCLVNKNCSWWCQRWRRRWNRCRRQLWWWWCLWQARVKPESMARLVGDDEAEHTGWELFWLPPPRSQIPDRNTLLMCLVVGRLGEVRGQGTILCCSLYMVKWQSNFIQEVGGTANIALLPEKVILFSVEWWVISLTDTGRAEQPWC